MVVQIDAGRFTAAAIPTKDKSPLPVDPNGMKPIKIAAQLLEMVAGRHPQVLIARRVVNHLEFSEEAAFQIGRNVPRPHVRDEEIPQPNIAKAHDHSANPRVRASVPLYGTDRNPGGHV